MPSVQQVGEGVIQADQEDLGRYYLHCNSSPAPVDPSMPEDEGSIADDNVVPELMFTENDTNFERLYGGNNVTPFVKDGFHDHIIPSHRPVETPTGEGVPRYPVPEEGYTSDSSTATSTPTPPRQFVNPEKKGTKAGAHYIFKDVPANGGCAVVRLKLTPKTTEQDSSIVDEESFDCVVEERRMDSDEFYSRFNSGALSDDLRNIMRQALSGMLWYVWRGCARATLTDDRTKQFYMFIQKEWIEGDPGQPPPPPERKFIRNMVRLPLPAIRTDD